MRFRVRNMKRLFRDKACILSMDLLYLKCICRRPMMTCRGKCKLIRKLSNHNIKMTNRIQFSKRFNRRAYVNNKNYKQSNKRSKAL